ncbi:MAG: fatty acid desaturase [Hyphomicrobium denitrificans]|nr:fatty acid desaturase [Hyphomicrobium denitrificans]
MDDFPIHFGGTYVLNLSLKQPLRTESRAELDPHGARLGAVVPDVMPESQKQRVRRLAAHCQTYRGSVPRLAIQQLVTTLVPLVLVIGAMFATVEHAYWATLLLALPAAGLLVRAFIIQHDCGHGSFFASRPVNDFVGRCMSVLTFAPYGLWRREHAQHHATSGNLDRRGAGDIDTFTVSEYLALPLLQRLRYRLYRNPLFLFGIGVPAYFVILQRLPWMHALPPSQTWRSVLGLNIGLALFYAPLFYFFGWSNVLWVGLPVLHVASAAGGWLFFIQHQFEETTWDKAEGWDFQVAALLGSSYYKLPRVLNWFTGNIGLHHIHHLNSMIPNYRLMACLNASPELQSINQLSLRDSLRCARLKLWDETERRLIRFDELPATR